MSLVLSLSMVLPLCAVQAVQQRLGTLSSPEGSQTASSQSHVFVGNSSSLKIGTALLIILTYLSE